MRRLPPMPAFALAFALAVGPAAAAETPGAQWKTVSPESAGWSRAKLDAASAYASTLQTAAVMVIHQGRVVYERGDVAKPFPCHSMRKSILSALYGPHVASGRIDLDRTLAALGLDDNEPSLTDVEKRATIRHLLQARSGIYHTALYESADMTASKPPRGSHPPGEFWHYNNWDFNALGTVFESLTGRSLYEEFEDRLAVPLGMQDFVRAEHTGYVTGQQSVHRAYPFVLSARDLARFGLLMLRRGRWGDRAILPESWIDESTGTYSDGRGGEGYGYMWWTMQKGAALWGAGVPPGTYSAHGYRGHLLYVIPAWDVVVVHRVDTFGDTDRVSKIAFLRLLGRLMEARPSSLKLEVPPWVPPGEIVARRLEELARQHPGEVYRLTDRSGEEEQLLVLHWKSDDTGVLIGPVGGDVETMRIRQVDRNGEAFRLELEGRGTHLTALGRHRGDTIEGVTYHGIETVWRWEGALVRP